MTPEEIEQAMFRVAGRGYDERQVDEFLDQAIARVKQGLPPLDGPPPAFGRALRGYNRAEVDAFVARLGGAAAVEDRRADIRPPAQSAVEEPKQGFLRRLLGG
ncbi:MAG: DivIVA domain-containing protein [Stackebrandtia sp.]